VSITLEEDVKFKTCSVEEKQMVNTSLIDGAHGCKCCSDVFEIAAYQMEQVSMGCLPAGCTTEVSNSSGARERTHLPPKDAIRNIRSDSRSHR
jgi:hypothetical protein